MTFSSIISEQVKKLDVNRNWWPKFFFHFTDVHNAARILYDGYIYSRSEAQRRSVMSSDNASTFVIDATRPESKTYGRLYFRPKTPTQYNNEGYKPQTVRNAEINANCPVPVFFLMDANGILQLDGTQFAERGISGNRADIREGIDEYSKLNFDKIYHDGSYDRNVDYDIKEYRHSEIIRHGGFPLEPYLRGLLCRSEAEKDTLLYLLKGYSVRLYNSYHNRIFYKPDLNCFYNNGVFLRNVMYYRDHLELELNDPGERAGVNDGKVFFFCRIFLQMKTKEGSVVDEIQYEGELDYNYIHNLSINLGTDHSYSSLRIKVIFDDSIMYENEVSVEDVCMA